jgi:hypothetical protein
MTAGDTLFVDAPAAAQVSLLDACRSNQHMRGLQARSIKFKHKTCEGLDKYSRTRAARRAKGEHVQALPTWPW